MVTFEDVVNNVEVKELMKNAQKQLAHTEFRVA